MSTGTELADRSVEEKLTDIPVRRDDTVADKWSEGAGVVSSWDDTVDAIANDGSAWEIAWNAAAAGLDTLGVVMNPLGELAAAGVGWLIEHVWFLHEPLDALAGDPIQIEDEARTWEAAAARMREISQQHVQSLEMVAGWQGHSADNYRAAVRGYAAGVDHSAGCADEAATAILASGADVATVRSLVRDTVAGFVGELIGAAVAAGIAAVFTAGGSVAAFVGWTITRAVQAAAEIVEKIAKLIGRLGRRAERLAELVHRFEALSEGLARQAERLTSYAESGLERAGRIAGVAEGYRQPDNVATRWLDETHRVPPALADGNRHGAMSNEELLTHGTDVLAPPVVEYGKQHTSRDWQRKVAEEHGQ